MKWEGCRIYDDAVRMLGYQRNNQHVSQEDLAFLEGSLGEAQVVKASSTQLAQIVAQINKQDANFDYRGPYRRTFVEFDQEVFTDFPERGVVGFLTVEEDDELQIWPAFRTPTTPAFLVYGFRYARDEEGRPVSGVPLALINNVFEDEYRNVKNQFESLVIGTFLYASALFELLRSTNVDLAAEPVSRQVRRKAKREDATIPLVVTVRRSSPSIARGGKVDYSHQFPVRGHFRYTTCGSKFNACPADKLVRRPDDGVLAVREWVSPHVKGPESKPYIPKILETRRLLGGEA